MRPGPDRRGGDDSALGFLVPAMIAVSVIAPGVPSVR